ncbi:MAG: hypothetical protein LBE02_07390 [Spirochaetaceae bacterium]|jgi:hypothetical protein|nr:hypothetical protein [Spirochaetaceae bacterium]
MKRRISVLLTCLVVLGLFLASCGGGRSALVGRWLLVEGSGFDSAELLNDGTGIADGSAITWKVEKNRLYISTPQVAMSFDYQLADSKLTLTGEDGETYVCLKPGGPSVLVGEWVPTEEGFFENLELAKDGRGNVDGEDFKWAADKNKLFIIDFGELEYKVSGLTLTLTPEGESSMQLKRK